MTCNTNRRLIISPNSSIFSGSTVVHGGSFTQQVWQQLSASSSKGGFERLLEASAPAAFHNSEERFDPPKCHPNTRVAVLQRITDWVLGTEADVPSRRAFMMWLYGAAGAGKSAIAQTVAEQVDADGSLLASFFFSRTDPNRNHARHLVATIAYQICLKIPDAKDSIVAAIEHDPHIFSKSLETQFARLIFEPLHSFTPSNYPKLRLPYLIILDGLDECVDTGVRCSILRLLMTAHRQHSLPPFLRFLIASRPELDIRTVIDSQDIETRPYRLVLDRGYHSNADIRLFLQDKFKEIKLYHPHRSYIPSEWPSDDMIEKLVQTSSGQFIYASTVLKFVSSEPHKPTNRLDIILGLRPAQSDAPFAALDELYTYIFSTVHELDVVLQVLGLVILGKGYALNLDEILDLEDGDISIHFSTLGSIVSVEKSWNFTDIKILHASLEDFLLDEFRSKKLYINPAAKHAEYAHIFFRHIKEKGTVKLHHIFSALIHNLEKAPPTSELHEDIIHFSLSKLYEDYLEYEPQSGFAMYFTDVVGPFLTCIKSLHWDEAANLHDIHQRHFDQMLSQRLEAYYAHPGLVFVLAVLSFIEPFEHLKKESLLHNTWNLLTGRACDIDREALAILVTSWIPAPVGYHRYFSQYLGDSTRCGPYAMTDERYAEAALYLYRLTCDIAMAIGKWSHIRVSDYLCILAMLLDRAGKSESLLDKIAHRRIDFRSEIGLLKKWCTPEDRELAEDALANYVRRMTEETTCS